MGSKLPHQDRTLLLHALSDLPQFTTVRGRQTLVRNALGGYELSGDVDKRLRWLDWEGGPIEVADGLIQLFDGYEPAAGIPALGLVAQAIEPLVGPPHDEKLVSMRHRLGWGADPKPASSETWRDERPPAEVVRERIIGEDTLRPIYYLREALRAADAVVRVEVGLSVGTGFLVAPDLMMTNHHVIADAEQARRAEASFFYELDIDRRKRATRTVGTADPALLFTDEELDLTLVRLRDPPPLAHYLPIRPHRLEQDQRVAIIQHPGGFLKKISLQNNLVAHADDRLVQYYTSTQAGSSGSPVFDDGFAVVAIHHSAVRDQGWDGGGQVRQPDPKQPSAKQLEELQWRNQGTSMVAIRDRLKAQAPGLLAEMTILD